MRLIANSGRRAAPRAPPCSSRRSASRAACASPPCQRIASVRLRARPSCRKWVWPLTASVRPMPQSGGVRHSRPSATTLGPMVGEALAHVVQQQVGVRPDQLVLQSGSAASVAPGRELGHVAGGAAGVVEQLACRAARSGRHTARGAPARRGGGRRTGSASMTSPGASRSSYCGLLPFGAARHAVSASVHSPQAAGAIGLPTPMSPAIALAALLSERRLAGLPAEAAEHRPSALARSRPGSAGRRCRRHRRRPGSACARMSSGDRLEQAEADHRRRDPRAQHDLGMHRAVGEVGDAVARRAQMHDLAACELDRQLLVVDHHAALRLRGPGIARSCSWPP